MMAGVLRVVYVAARRADTAAGLLAGNTGAAMPAAKVTVSAEIPSTRVGGGALGWREDG